MAGLAAAGVHHWAALLLPGFGYFLAHGINFPCGQVGSVAPFPRHAGAAAGLFGFTVMAVAALTGVWIGATHNGTVYPLAFTMAAYAAPCSRSSSAGSPGSMPGRSCGRRAIPRARILRV